MAIECLVLGAGQEVGKSCVVVTMGGKKIMFDCGMHMGHHDHLRYPNFSLISQSGDFDKALTCIIITHFHLDHVGALAYFTEVCGYNGPIYMTYPTKALAPLMLEDYRKVMVERRGEQEQFSSNHIMDCMKKVTAVDLKQTVQVDKDLQIRAYYAGHVLGAAMFYVKVGDSAIVYTGDYNMTPDRHLGAAQIDRLQLDLVISESTYATKIREPKCAREREFLMAVHNCVAGGGKVLIPTFALGRAQELCILLDDYWERLNLKIPIYFSAGLTIQANMYYKMLIGWTSQKIKDSYATQNAFDFKHVCSFDRSLLNAPGPCVLFATPGMISGGFSLQVFKQWAPSEINLIALPGYCVSGTIGHQLMSGKPKKIRVDKDTEVDVRCQIHQLSFSPHTDAKGIMDLVKFLSPKHVVLVHGEKPSMEKLKGRIESELGIQCYNPANNETVYIPSPQCVKIDATETFFRKSLVPRFACLQDRVKDSSHMKFEDADTLTLKQIKEENIAEGILVMKKAKRGKAVSQDELLPSLAVDEHTVQFAYCCSVSFDKFRPLKPHTVLIPESSEISSSEVSCGSSNVLAESMDSGICVKHDLPIPDRHSWLHRLFLRLSNELEGENIQEFPKHLQIKSVNISICKNRNSCPYRIMESPGNESSVFFCCKWSLVDQTLAWIVISLMKGLDPSTV